MIQISPFQFVTEQHHLEPTDLLDGRIWCEKWHKNGHHFHLRCAEENGDMWISHCRILSASEARRSFRGKRYYRFLSDVFSDTIRLVDRSWACDFHPLKISILWCVDDEKISIKVVDIWQPLEELQRATKARRWASMTMRLVICRLTQSTSSLSEKSQWNYWLCNWKFKVCNSFIITWNLGATKGTSSMTWRKMLIRGEYHFVRISRQNCTENYYWHWDGWSVMAKSCRCSSCAIKIADLGS